MNTIGALALAVRRHPWTSALDATLLFLVMTGAVLLALEYETVTFWDQLSERRRRIRLEEIFLLTAILMLGLAVFMLRRIKEASRDRERELKAELEAETARALAMQDPLTGLPNRRELEAALASAVARPPAADSMHAFLLLDLNGFKRINDERGHAVGDEVLRGVGERFRTVARKGDLVARIGGDEFAVLACDVASHEQAIRLGERFVSALSEDVAVAGSGYSVGVSVGIALYPEDGGNAAELMQRADLAMYKAKAAKRSGVELFGGQPRAPPPRTTLRIATNGSP
jgi:diguanylate cyclase (GGDEF)-like protein